ncbi:TonB-dependent receptor [Flavobacteriaceae bacterium]|nr:TonB-dependent receptor [Flavobacteriaceae bacterium]
MKNILVIIAFFQLITVNAQEEIKKEDVVVEFSFNPSLSDVFKLKTNPNTTVTVPKTKINYEVSSKEVPSDFEPTIKKVEYVPVNEEIQKLYPHYVYAVAGLYGNAELDLMLRPKNFKGFEYSIDVRHTNNQNGITSVLDNGTLSTFLNLYVKNKTENFRWGSNIGFDRNQVRWFGADTALATTAYENLNVKQLYNTFLLSGKLDFENGLVKTIEPSLAITSDSYNSNEIDFKVKASGVINLFKKDFDSTLEVNTLSGGFKQSYASLNAIDYNFFNVAFTPRYNIKKENWSLNSSVSIVIASDAENNNTKLLVLPNVEYSTAILKDLMTFNGGFRSSFTQNSYYSLLKKNLFIAPTINLRASYVPSELYAGLSGKLSRALSYQTEVGYSLEKNKALFVNNNAISALGVVANPYEAGNTFGLVYDDVNTLKLKGLVSYEINNNLTTKAVATANFYSAATFDKTWNLPTYKLESVTSYTYQKWYGQLGAYIVGSRYDLVANNSTKIKGFVDVNLKGQYNFNNRFSAHANIYNMLANKYESYINYQVQSIQAVIGVSYKF